MSGGSPAITVQEWNGMAFVTVLGGQLPTLALPPKGVDQMQMIQMQQQAQQAAVQAQYEEQQPPQQQQQQQPPPQQQQGSNANLTSENLQNMNNNLNNMNYGDNNDGNFDEERPQAGAYDNFRQ
eukprot:97579_1